MPKTPYELFGIECGKGWEGLYNPLIDMAIKEGSRIVQIKEKFGGLRFYVDGGSQSLYKAIAKAEEKSYTVCERCGKSAKQTSVNGWITTRCGDHAPSS